MGRLLGLDYGTKTTGIAMSDPAHMIASPIETIKREKEGKLRPTLRRIIELVKQHEVEGIVLGYPLNMDGTRGERAVKTEEFRTLLEHRLFAAGLDVPVIMWDERLSTAAADDVLFEAGIAPDDRKQYIDKIAAAIILEDFINAEKMGSADKIK